MLNNSPCIPVLFPPQLVGEQVLVLLVFPPGISSEALTADDLLPVPFFVQLPLRCELQKLSVVGNGETQARAYGKNKHSVTQCKNIFHNLNMVERSLNDSVRMLSILRNYSLRILSIFQKPILFSGISVQCTSKCIVVLFARIYKPCFL